MIRQPISRFTTSRTRQPKISTVFVFYRLRHDRKGGFLICLQVVVSDKNASQPVAVGSACFISTLVL